MGLGEAGEQICGAMVSAESDRPKAAVRSYDCTTQIVQKSVLNSCPLKNLRALGSPLVSLCVSSLCYQLSLQARVAQGKCTAGFLGGGTSPPDKRHPEEWRTVNV